MLNMTYKLSALVVCVVFSFFGLASSQKNCCAPKQWTGIIIQRIGRYDRTHDSASLNDAFTRFTYDSINMKTAAITEINKNISTQAMVKERTIRDYKQKRKWVIVDNNCSVNPLTEALQAPCIPDYFLKMNIYENVTSGISDPMVFHIPNFCPSKNEEVNMIRNTLLYFQNILSA
ncbi:hypothetical protein FSP39_018382 [Pinctada imbricata]|uniref:Uncharacterized protein n=1 Tax=Pinctada imbricata TaxID=66713 RepID=A0AA89C805_PINIB|nr:hypothetical protein FSP39_018382 [Pinctada imbricata]